MKMPDKNFWGGFAAGFLWGGVAVFLLGVVYLRHSLVMERECAGAFDGIVKELPNRASMAKGWSLSPVSCALPQSADGCRMRSFRLCNGAYAKEMVDIEADRKISSLIPCSVSVYEKSDGKTYMARLNMSLLARILGGSPAKVFPSKAAPDQDAMLEGLLK